MQIAKFLTSRKLVFAKINPINEYSNVKVLFNGRENVLSGNCLVGKMSNWGKCLDTKKKAIGNKDSSFQKSLKTK